MFITITGLHHYAGSGIFKVGQIVELEKDLDNNYDDEAIRAYIKGITTVGYVANSINTKAIGTRSAGRIYDTFKEKTKAKVLFIFQDSVIAEIIENEKKS